MSEESMQDSEQQLKLLRAGYDYHDDPECLFDENLEAPKQVDLRPDLSPIMRQTLHCGCCWAISPISSAESAYKARYNVSIQLSVQELVNCAVEHGCEIGKTAIAFNYLVTNGTTTQKAYPYTAKVSTFFCCKNINHLRNIIHRKAHAILPKSHDIS